MLACLRGCEFDELCCFPFTSAYLVRIRHPLHEGNRQTTRMECWMGPAVMIIAIIIKQTKEEDSMLSLLRCGTCVM